MKSRETLVCPGSAETHQGEGRERGGGLSEREGGKILPRSWELARVSSNLITYLSLKLFMVR